VILIDLLSANTTFVTIVDAGPRGLGRPANRTSIEQTSLSAINTGRYSKGDNKARAVSIHGLSIHPISIPKVAASSGYSGLCFRRQMSSTTGLLHSYESSRLEKYYSIVVQTIIACASQYILHDHLSDSKQTRHGLAQKKKIKSRSTSWTFPPSLMPLPWPPWPSTRHFGVPCHKKYTRLQGCGISRGACCIRPYAPSSCRH